MHHLVGAMSMSPSHFLPGISCRISRMMISPIQDVAGNSSMRFDLIDGVLCLMVKSP